MGLAIPSVDSGCLDRATIWGGFSIGGIFMLKLCNIGDDFMPAKGILILWSLDHFVCMAGVAGRKFSMLKCLCRIHVFVQVKA